MEYRKRRHKVIANLAIAAVAALTANLVVATIATADSPTIPDINGNGSVTLMKTGSPDGFGITQYGTKPDNGGLPSGVDESYFTENDIMFYRYNRTPHPTPAGCDLESSDYRANPLCKGISPEERIARLDYRDNFLNKPVYKCADGRNNGLGWQDTHKFRPCPTGATRLRLKGGKLSMVHTTDRVRINIANGNNPKVVAAWYFMITPEDMTTGGRGYRLQYVHANNVTPFTAFVRKDGGAWKTTNANDPVWSAGGKYEFLFTYNVKGRTTPAWLPFKNECLPNNEVSNLMNC